MEENVGVQTDVADPSTEEKTNQTSEPQETQKATEDSNWKEAREVMRQQQREIQELKEQLVKNQPQEKLDELDSLASDDIVTVAQARKLAEKVAERTTSKLLKEKEVETMEDRASIKYPDYAEVVTKYIPKIIKDDPDLAETIRNSPNPYIAAYKIAKTSYLYNQDKNNSDKANQTTQKILENSSKPQSVHSQGYQGALSDAKNFENNSLSSERKKEVWELSSRFAQGR